MEKADEPAKNSELSPLYKDLKRARKEAQLYKNKYNQLIKAATPTPSAENQSVVAPVQGQTSAQPEKEHTWKPWQAACATCGEKNLAYKRETKCDNCGGMLGTVEVARKLDFCPHCTLPAKFVPLTEEAKKKVEAMVRPNG